MKVKDFERERERLLAKAKERKQGGDVIIKHFLEETKILNEAETIKLFLRDLREQTENREVKDFLDKAQSQAFGWSIRKRWPDEELNSIVIERIADLKKDYDFEG